jgi:16S rRNA processing protein RimM
VAAPGFAIVGRIRKAHGIRGEVLVEPITDTPDAVFAPGRRVFAGTTGGDRAPDGARLAVTEVRPFKGGLLVRFDAISDRTEAELWRDRYLLAPFEELEPPHENQVYIQDLVGMRVIDRAGTVIGEVAEVYELPQGLVLDVRRGEGREDVMIPYREGVVVRTSSADRVVEIDPPDGLLD